MCGQLDGKQEGLFSSGRVDVDGLMVVLIKVNILKVI